MDRISTSAKAHYFRRGSTYAYRRRIPGDVRHDPVFKGREHHHESLKTSDPTEAARAAARVTEWFDKEVCRVRGIVTPTNIPSIVWSATTLSSIGLLADKDLEGMRGRWWKILVEDNKQGLLSALTDPDGLTAGRVAAREGHARGAVASFYDRLERRRSYIERWITPEIEPIVRRVCEHQNISIGSLDYSSLLYTIANSEAAILESRFRRKDYSSVGTVKSTSVERSLKCKGERPGAFWTISELAAHCIEVRNRGASWNHKVETVAHQFETFLGDARPISVIRSVDINAYVQTLLNCPARADLRFPSCGLKEAVQLNRSRPEGQLPTIDPNTIKNTHVAALNWLLTYANSELEAIPSNPAANIRVDGFSKKKETRTRFQPDELEKLFRLPVFVGCRGSHRPGIVGDVLLNDHRFWTPLILLYMGARPSEVAQLSVSDINLEAAHPYISILSEYDPSGSGDQPRVKSEKTANARRVIPIHPELLRLGFGRYVEAIRNNKSLRLFPEWKASADERKSYSQASWIRAFNKKYMPLVSARIPRPTLYSFRYNFISRLIAAGVPPQIQNQILGHSKFDMDPGHYDYGVSLADVATQMAKVSHGDLCLNHLIR